MNEPCCIQHYIRTSPFTKKTPNLLFLKLSVAIKSSLAYLISWYCLKTRLWKKKHDLKYMLFTRSSQFKNNPASLAEMNGLKLDSNTLLVFIFLWDLLRKISVTIVRHTSCSHRWSVIRLSDAAVLCRVNLTSLYSGKGTFEWKPMVWESFQFCSWTSRCYCSAVTAVTACSECC